MRVPTLIAAVSVGLLAGCAAGPPPDARILAMGDSILSWNSLSGRDVPTLVGRATGLTVHNVARNGANVMREPGIGTQYIPGDWDYVIVTGGGNDLAQVCLSPSAAEARVNELLGPDLGGTFTKMLIEPLAAGAEVIILGYPPVSLRGGPFRACAEQLAVLSARQAELAARVPGVTFVDARDVISPDDRQAYGIDRVHPTPYATQLMAELIAAEILN